MPDTFHQQQYLVAGGLAALCIVLYAFAPEARSEGLLALTTTLVGFCAGKFSNGFKRDARPAEDDPEETLLRKGRR